MWKNWEETQWCGLTCGFKWHWVIQLKPSQLSVLLLVSSFALWGLKGLGCVDYLHDLRQQELCSCRKWYDLKTKLKDLSSRKYCLLDIPSAPVRPLVLLGCDKSGVLCSSLCDQSVLVTYRGRKSSSYEKSPFGTELLWRCLHMESGFFLSQAIDANLLQGLKFNLSFTPQLISSCCIWC